MNKQDWLKSLHMLKEELAPFGSLAVVHEGGHRWEAGFEWCAPTPLSKLHELSAQADILVPEAYLAFLSYTDGATVYKDMVYGQWGYVLYSVEALFANRAKWHQLLDIPKRFLVFAECLGDADLLMFDLHRRTADGRDAVVVYDEECTPLSECRIIEGAFEQWLDHLIVAQGAKYWNWGVRGTPHKVLPDREIVR